MKVLPIVVPQKFFNGKLSSAGTVTLFGTVKVNVSPAFTFTPLGIFQL